MHLVLLSYSCISCQVFTMMRVSWLLQKRIIQTKRNSSIYTCKPNSLAFGLLGINKFRPSIFHSCARESLILCWGTSNFVSPHAPAPALTPERESLSTHVDGLRNEHPAAFALAGDFRRGRPLSARFPGRGPARRWGGHSLPEQAEESHKGLTERDWLVDLEAAEDPVHVAGVPEAVPSHDYLKWFWNK